MGKWLGFVGMLTLYVALMVGGTTAVTYFLSGYTPHHLLRGVSLMWLESLLLLTLTFLFGTSFSTLTNGVLASGLHGLAFVGGWIEEFGALSHSPRAVNVGIIASIIIPSEALWRRLGTQRRHGGLCRHIPRSSPQHRHAPLRAARLVEQ